MKLSIFAVALAALVAFAPLSAGAGNPVSDAVSGGSQAVSGAFGQVWTRMQSGVCDKIRARIEQPNAIAKGTTAYDTTCAFGNPGPLALDNSRFGSGILGFTYSIPGNALDFKTKTPLGTWADPKFHVTYDLVIVSHLSANFGMPPLSVNDAVANVDNVKVHGGNLTGSMASLFISPSVNESIDLKQALGDAIAAQWPKK